MRPDFIIAGAPKAGTTSLFHALRSHPEMFLPEVKEPDFFVTEESLRTVSTREQYDRLFTHADAAGAKVFGEASVNYLHDEAAASRIRAELG
ncbi:MAG: sulfotransferase, partial [Gemmatimonadetes bacterium]|nr:sulfotransferase [Gemmatimonadota bacterium]